MMIVLRLGVNGRFVTDFSALTYDDVILERRKSSLSDPSPTCTDWAFR